MNIGARWGSANRIPNRGRKLARRDAAAAGEPTTGGAAVRRATGEISQVSRCDTDGGGEERHGRNKEQHWD